MIMIFNRLAYKNFILMAAVILLVAALSGCSLGNTAFFGAEKVPGTSSVKEGQSSASGTGTQPQVTPSQTVSPQVTPPQSASPQVTPTQTASPQAATPVPIVPKKVPILYYHAVNDEPFGIKELFIKPDMFEKQMEYLKLNNYTPIQFEQLGKLEGIEKPIIISFDDGYSDNYSIMYPILKKFGFKAVIFPIIDMVGQENYLTWEQILAMRDIISFQNHTMTHRELIYLDSQAIEQEMSEASKQLEAKTGQKVITVSYPIGLYNNAVKAAAKKYFKYGVTTDSGLYEPGSDNYQMPRIYVQRSDSLERFINMVKGLED